MVPLGENVGFILAQDGMFVQTSSSIPCLGGEYRWNSHKIKHDVRNLASFWHLFAFLVSAFSRFLAFPALWGAGERRFFLALGFRGPSYRLRGQCVALRGLRWPQPSWQVKASETWKDEVTKPVSTRAAGKAKPTRYLWGMMTISFRSVQSFCVCIPWSLARIFRLCRRTFCEAHRKLGTEQSTSKATW